MIRSNSLICIAILQMMAGFMTIGCGSIWTYSISGEYCRSEADIIAPCVFELHDATVTVTAGSVGKMDKITIALGIISMHQDTIIFLPEIVRILNIGTTVSPISYAIDGKEMVQMPREILISGDEIRISFTFLRSQLPASEQFSISLGELQFGKGVGKIRLGDISVNLAKYRKSGGY